MSVVAERAPPRHLGLPRALGLSFTTIGATLLLGAGAEAACARAWTWVQLAVAGLAVHLAVALALVLWHRRDARRLALALAVLGLARVAWAVAPRAPRVTPGALVVTRFARGEGPHDLWFAGVPERETVRLGAWVGLSPEEWKEAGASLDAAYAAIEEGDLLERSESPLLDSWVRDREHFWLAAPRAPAGPVPLVVFVHGNGGSFQFYPDLLAREAVARGFAIAFVSYGFGLWGGPGDAARIGRVVDAVSREVRVDPARVSLVGLSAGGPGIFGAALAEPARYRSLVALSAIAPDLTSSSALRQTRVLILHGTGDPRARIEWARAARDQLARAGVPVELDERDASHLAVLTERKTWVPRILDWITTH